MQDIYQNNEKDPSIWRTFSQYLNRNVLGIYSNVSEDINSSMEDEISNCNSNSTSYIFRVHPLLNGEENIGCCRDRHNPIKNPYNIFTHRENLPDWYQEVDSCGERIPLLCNLSVVSFKEKNLDKNSPVSENQSTETDINKGKNNSSNSGGKASNSVCVRLYGISCKCKTFSAAPTRISFVFVSSTIRQFLKLSVGSKVKLTRYKPELDYLLFQVYIKQFGNTVSIHKRTKVIVQLFLVVFFSNM